MITLSLRMADIQKINQDLSRRLERTQANKAALMDRYGIWFMELTSELSPYRTGFMSRHVVYKPLKKGWHDFEVGWYNKDFVQAGKEPYYIYQEFGTLYNNPQPSLGPAFRALSPRLKQDAKSMLSRSMGDNL